MRWGIAARLAVVLALAGAACTVPSPEKDPPAGPQRGATVLLRATSVGTPIGVAATAAIGAAGGTLTSLDGRATLAVPAGALAEQVTFSVEEITSTAPGAVGSGYRFGPATVAMPQLTLAFTPGTPSLDGLTLAVQNGQDFWLRHRDVARDTGTLSVVTSRLGDWSVVRSNTAADLRGAFTLSSTRDLPFTADGDATLNYGGDDTGGAHYLQWGTLTLRAPVPLGATTCDPAAAAWPLHANVADLSVARQRFDWGISGVWQLACADGGQTSLMTAFDTLGVSDHDCARGWSGTPTISLVRVSGTYVVDCGARGSSTVTLDFQSCDAGAACDPGIACRAGTTSCAGTYPACLLDGNVPNGDPCTGGTCLDGLCTP